MSIRVSDALRDANRNLINSDNKEIKKKLAKDISELESFFR